MEHVGISGIILAAGKGSRMKPLTERIPKSMAEFEGKTLLEHNLDPLVDLVDEFVIVINWLGDTIQDFVGNSYKGIPVTYAFQQNPKGGTLDSFRTGVKLASDSSKGFIVANSDNVLGPKMYTSLSGGIQNNPNSLYAVAKRIEDREELKQYGIFQVNEKSELIGISVT